MQLSRYGLMVVLACAIAGCAAQPTTGGGGGGGGDDAPTDPLPEIQLGQDAALDADIVAIRIADNASLNCIDRGMPFDDEEVLMDLKNGFVNGEPEADTFQQFVADVRTIEESKRDQICNINVGDDETLDGLLDRIVAALQEAAVCAGDESDFTNESVLRNVKGAFFTAGIAATDLIAYTADVADETEREADDMCSESGG